MKKNVLPFLAIACLLAALSCSSDSGPSDPAADSDQVDDYMAGLPAWDSVSPVLAPIGQPEEEETGPTEIEYDLGGSGEIMICNTTPCSITATPEDLVTFNPNVEILWVGSLIQGDSYLGGLGSMQSIEIDQRAPLTISIDLTFSDNMRVVQHPQKSSVGQAIGELITAAENAGHQAGSVCVFDKKECYSLDQSMLNLGFSAKYGLGAVAGQLSYSQSVEEHTITAYFKQRMFTVSMDLPSRPSDLFSSDFTQELLDEQVALGNIGPGNLPVYVSSIAYGRIFLMTMTSTHSATQMMAALQAKYASVSGEIEVGLQNVINSSVIHIAALGGTNEAAAAAITGSLNDYFTAAAPLTSMVPLSYTLRSVRDNTIAYVSETTDYDMVQCSENNVALYTSYDNWHDAVLAIDADIVPQSTSGTAMYNAHVVNTLYGDYAASNVNIGSVLAFHPDYTGIPVGFTLRCLQTNAQFTYNDDDMQSFYRPCLSVGNVDAYENDDFSVADIAGEGAVSVYAAGIYVGDNGAENGEWLKVYGPDHVLMATFTKEQTPSWPNGAIYVWMGVVSGVPITEISFDEGSGGDDLCIANPAFGVLGVAP